MPHKYLPRIPCRLECGNLQIYATMSSEVCIHANAAILFVLAVACCHMLYWQRSAALPCLRSTQEALSSKHHDVRVKDLNKYLVYLRDEIAFLMGFDGLLRRSEIVALKLSDVTCVDESEAGAYIKLCIRKSKTDQQARGAEVIVADISRHGVNVMERLSR